MMVKCQRQRQSRTKLQNKPATPVAKTGIGKKVEVHGGVQKRGVLEDHWHGPEVNTGRKTGNICARTKWWWKSFMKSIIINQVTFSGYVPRSCSKVSQAPHDDDLDQRLDCPANGTWTEILQNSPKSFKIQLFSYLQCYTEFSLWLSTWILMILNLQRQHKHLSHQLLKCKYIFGTSFVCILLSWVVSCSFDGNRRMKAGSGYVCSETPPVESCFCMIDCAKEPFHHSDWSLLHHH